MNYFQPINPNKNLISDFWGGNFLHENLHINIFGYLRIVLKIFSTYKYNSINLYFFNISLGKYIDNYTSIVIIYS